MKNETQNYTFETALAEVKKRFGEDWENVKTEHPGNQDYNPFFRGISINADKEFSISNRYGWLCKNGEWATLPEEKKEPDYEPHNFESAKGLIGQAIQNKKTGSITLIVSVGDHYINGETFRDYFNDFDNLDGKPFGKLKDDSDE